VEPDRFGTTTAVRETLDRAH